MKLSRNEFDTLALEHLDVLYRLARRLTRGDAASADDLVQETYVRAFKAAESFDLQEFGIRPWLIRILHNLHFSRAKREKRQPAVIGDEQLDSASGSHVDDPAQHVSVQAGRAATERSFNFDVLDERLVSAVEELPEEYQTTLLLWAVDDLTYKEIAEACDVPIGTVMSRLHRARQRLADKLSDYARQEGVIRD